MNQLTKTLLVTAWMTLLVIGYITIGMIMADPNWWSWGWMPVVVLFLTPVATYSITEGA